MSKAPQLFSSSYPQGTNLSTNKKVYKATTYQVSNSNQKQDNKIEIEEKKATRSSFRVFKYLIVTTVIIFAFGGFGFGMALRFNQSSANVTQSK